MRVEVILGGRGYFGWVKDLVTEIGPVGSWEFTLKVDVGFLG